MEEEFFCVYTERNRVLSLYDCIRMPSYVAATGGEDECVRRRAEPAKGGGAAPSTGNSAPLSKPKK